MIIIKPLMGLLMLLHPHLVLHPVIDPGTAEACFVQQTNATRASKGLSILPVSSSLASQARSHSAVMASSNSLYHSTADQYPGNWTGLGENVGVGPTCDDIEAAFLASPHHYENIVNPQWTTLGIGVALSPDGGTVWVTVAFELFPSAAPAAPPAAAPAPVTAPAPAPVAAPVRTTAAPAPVRTTAPAPVKTTAPVPVRTTPAPVPVPVRTTAAPVASPVASPAPTTPPVAVPVAEPAETATSPTASAPPSSTVTLPAGAQTLVAAQASRGFIGLAIALALCLSVGGLWGVRDRRRR